LSKQAFAGLLHKPYQLCNVAASLCVACSLVGWWVEQMLCLQGACRDIGVSWVQISMLATKVQVTFLTVRVQVEFVCYTQR
jgi:hypothetical protein